MKTIFANYALDKLKIEIAGNFISSIPLPSPLGKTAPRIERNLPLEGRVRENQLTGLSVTFYLEISPKLTQFDCLA